MADEKAVAPRTDVRVALKRLRNDVLEVELHLYQLLDRVERLEVAEAERQRAAVKT